MKPEPTQPGNPHALTIRQHLFPRRSIERFAQASGNVHVHFLSMDKMLHLSPSDQIFCAKRVWDHRAETGFMKRIEDGFQELAERILMNLPCTLSGEAGVKATEFYALWRSRTYYNQHPIADTKLNGVSGVEFELTKDDEERLEKRGINFVRSDTSFIGRQMTGMMIFSSIDEACIDLEDCVWASIVSQNCDFIVPDVPPTFPYIPISPGVSLVGNNSPGKIHPETTIKLNKILLSNCASYCYAQDLDRCQLNAE